jgi:hypothetical protein
MKCWDLLIQVLSLIVTSFDEENLFAIESKSGGKGPTACARADYDIFIAADLGGGISYKRRRRIKCGVNKAVVW